MTVSSFIVFRLSTIISSVFALVPCETLLLSLLSKICLQRIADIDQIVLGQILVDAEVKPVLADILGGRELPLLIAKELEYPVLGWQAAEESLALDTLVFQISVKFSAVVFLILEHKGESVGTDLLVLFLFDEVAKV